MRTTLTIDDDLHMLLMQIARQERRSLKEVLNDALRKALVNQQTVETFRVDVQHSALQPGVDPHRLNQLADEIEDDELAERLER